MVCQGLVGHPERFHACLVYLALVFKDYWGWFRDHHNTLADFSIFKFIQIHLLPIPLFLLGTIEWLIDHSQRPWKCFSVCWSWLGRPCSTQGVLALSFKVCRNWLRYSKSTQGWLRDLWDILVFLSGFITTDSDAPRVLKGWLRVDSGIFKALWDILVFFFRFYQNWLGCSQGIQGWLRVDSGIFKALWDILVFFQVLSQLI